MLKPLVSALALFAATSVLASPSTELKAVIEAHWAATMADNPEYASSLGEHGGDGKLRDNSLEADDRSAARAEAFRRQLAAIPDSGLTPSERTDKAILLNMLSEQVEGARFGQRMMLFTTYAGWHQDFAGLADNSPFDTAADYESYLGRLAAYPKYNDTALAITRRAVAEGYVQPCAVLGGFETSITGVIRDKVEESRFYQPFLGNAPTGMTAADWAAMKARATRLIKQVVEPEYEKFADYYTADYKPKCRATVGASDLPQGKAFYALQVRSHTTTDMSPDAVHTLGLGEVARIGAEMDALATSAGFASRAAFIAELRRNPKYYARTPDELLAAAARQAKAIDGLMPKYFGRLPRLPYGLRPVPAETAEGTTTAYYNPGSPPSGIAGFYYVNTSKLDQRPLWELPALTAHEAVPGHHNQIALQQEMELPKFRRYLAGYTAYTEGWGLYSEHLGVEMGLYDTPEKNMGRLSYEMWRACRLVVDTCLHSKGWTKARAIAFMRANTALSDANIEAEVNRYISWPGQALGYKIGELKIRALRAKAQSALGANFDLRGFHDAVLAQGAVPLNVLEVAVDDWIASKR